MVSQNAHVIAALEFLVVFSIANAYLLGPTTSLRIANARVSPDGFTRVAVLAEGTFPGPMITAMKGDRFAVNVQNDLTDLSMLTSTSIHWHGLHVQGSNWADGTVSVTQCPVSPGHAFEYIFSGGSQAGTYWYHSHLTSQYCDGLRGPLIIYDPQDPHRNLYDVDDESMIISLSDWYRMSPQPYKPFNSELTSNSTLINGLGRYKGGPKSPLAVLNVEQGKRYRLRFISMACDPYFTVSIDGHEMTIIEADGTNVAPLNIDSFEIFAGQRYSAVLHASNRVGNYWIRVDTSKGPSGFEGGINSAVLRYRGASEEEPATKYSDDIKKKVLKEVDLRPLDKSGVPGKPQRNGADININLVFEKDKETSEYLMNGVTYKPPTVPVLLQILSGATDAGSLLPPGSIYYLPLNKTVQVSMPIQKGVGGNPHPMHLHGHKFSVVRSAGSSEYNYENAIWRDVVSAGDEGDNVTIRWKTDNSGPWFFHCHLEDHLEKGMAIVFAEDVRGVAKANPVPGSWKALCPIYEQQFDVWSQDKMGY
ncbi:hypothetical protein V5O48_008893 [Marasmius crinis-equi]|uniref:Laccase n=1 Tax=Marasmius crinis-equi TaxID=585013 RepID=A0ABR3FCQ9_9AGAR